MMKTMLLAILTRAIFFAFFASPALAWISDEEYATSSELPESVRVALPSGQTYLDGMRGDDAIYVLTDAGDGTRRVWVFGEKDDDWRLECESVALPKRNGKDAMIGCSGAMLHMLYPPEILNFTRDRDDTWALSSLQVNRGHDIEVCAGWISCETLENGVWEKCYLFAPIPRALDSIDVTHIPTSLEAALEMVDTERLAVISSDNPSTLQPLYAAPSLNAASLGEYYNGAPVEILEAEGDWCKVSIAGVEGYILHKSLASGLDMLMVERASPRCRVSDENAEVGTPVHEKPDNASELAGRVFMDNAGFIRYVNLGIVDDEWYHVLCFDGMAGFIEARHFYFGSD
jgi:hypothetical protein